MRARRRRGVRGQALDVTLRCFSDTVGADTAMLLGRSDGHTEVLSSWARDGHQLPMAWTSRTLIGQASEAPGPLLEPAAEANGDAAVAAIAAPIRFDQRALGVIYAGFSPGAQVGAGELGWTVDSYARIAALCITGDLTLAAVLGSAGFDVLTGCLSYGGLLEVLKGEVERSLRAGHRLSCCFLDLDGFKRVNDTQGHLEGNRVLAAVGQALRQSARTYDAVGRFGGDEFVVVLPETGAADGRSIAARYRGAVRAAISESTSMSLDVSVGIAEWDSRGSAADLLGAADWALSEAKSGGGGAIVPASADTRVDGLLELTKDLMRRRRRTSSEAGRDRDPAA
jgi:diguanylate cyclase (GGDEF)-like protein